MTLSRMVAVVVAGCAVPAHADVIDHYQQLTQVTVHGCAKPASSHEILVCGNRRADHWRVPFLDYDAGDPRGETVSMERNRLASQPQLRCGLTLFTNNCKGKVGIGYSSNFATSGRLRPLGE